MAIKWKDNIRRLFLNFNLIDIVLLILSLFVFCQMAISQLHGNDYSNYVAKKIGMSRKYLTKMAISDDYLTFRKYVKKYEEKEKEKTMNTTEKYLKDNLKNFNINDPVSRSDFRIFLSKNYEKMLGIIILNKEENYIITNESGMISSSFLSINEDEAKKLNDDMEAIYYKLNNFDNFQKLAGSLNDFKVHKNIDITEGNKVFNVMMFSNLSYLDSEIDMNVLYIIKDNLKIFGIAFLIVIFLLTKLILSIKRYKKDFFRKIVEEDFILNINGNIGLRTRFYIQLTLEILMILILLLSIIKSVQYERFSILYFTFNQQCVQFGIILLILVHLLKSYKLLKVREKIEKLSKGNYEKIKIKNIDYNKEIYSMINNISDGYNNMLLENTKNERLKTELITNISHDLKTPLTSIINYVDILNNQKVKEEDKKKYLNIIEKKAYRLKTLILDLFEVSKLSSGKVELEKNNLNIVDLVYQCLGECETSNIDKNLDIIVNKNEEPINVMVDGELLSRAFENVINNIYKYSLEGTRVYIDIIKDKENFKITFKNISKYPLNFDGKELFERFVRGDIARNSSTEGSGLGLAIAKAVVELHGFKIDIKINGDLFLLEISSK